MVGRTELEISVESLVLSASLIFIGNSIWRQTYYQRRRSRCKKEIFSITNGKKKLKALHFSYTYINFSLNV
jgi:hypothetical protein